MKFRYASPILFLLVCLQLQLASARDWMDATGRHKFEGELIAASPDTVLLRGKPHKLQAYVVKELSQADQTFVKEYIELKQGEIVPEKMHTWMGRDGFSFRGRVIGYGSQVVSVTYELARIRVNQKPISEIDEIYQTMIPKIIAEFDDKSVKSEKDLSAWGRKLLGKEKSFTVDGVMMRLEDGEKIAFPLFLFSDEERIVLEAGWDTWKAKATKEDEQKRESFLAAASAAEYQRNREAEVKTNQQIQLMQLGLMAVNAGVTNVWQVQMVPRSGVRARSMVVVVPAFNSVQASAMAAEKYPGFIPGAIRQMNY